VAVGRCLMRKVTQKRPPAKRGWRRVFDVPGGMSGFYDVFGATLLPIALWQGIKNGWLVELCPSCQSEVYACRCADA
jgi:hypothetical protein